MSKLKLLVLVLFLLAPISSLGEEVSDQDALNWHNAFVERARVMEEEYGIEFDVAWKPVIAFEIPSDIPPAFRYDFSARYNFDTETITIAPKLKQQVKINIVDHELGHALVDQLSRRIGNRMWPGPENDPNVEWDGNKRKSKWVAQMGLSIICEGLGSYFEFHGKPPYSGEEELGYNWLPESYGDLRWQATDVQYLGGYWLIAPIVRKYGEEGIIYLIKNPFSFEDGNAQKAAFEYQRKALKKLARKRARQFKSRM